MTATSLGHNRFTVGQSDRWWKPRVHSSRPPLVFMYGGGFTALDGPSFSRFVVDALVADGWTVVMPSVPYLFGNAASVTRIGDAVSFARSQLGCTNDPPVIVGQSNGGICGLQYAAQHDTAAVVGMIVPVDVDAIYEGDILSLRSLIATAWGVTYPTPLPADASPSDRVDDLLGIPIQLWEASDDPLAINVAAFSAALGADFHNVGALGHSDAATAAVDAEVVVDFIADNT